MALVMFICAGLKLIPLSAASHSLYSLQQSYPCLPSPLVYNVRFLSSFNQHNQLLYFWIRDLVISPPSHPNWTTGSFKDFHPLFMLYCLSPLILTRKPCRSMPQACLVLSRLLQLWKKELLIMWSCNQQKRRGWIEEVQRMLLSITPCHRRVRKPRRATWTIVSTSSYCARLLFGWSHL